MKVRAFIRWEVIVGPRKYSTVFIFLAVFVLIIVLLNTDFLEITLVHPSEAVTVLRRLTSEQPDRIYFQSLFRSGSVSQTTTCNICLRPTQQPLCNYTDLRTGEPWFCYKPTKLSCDARIIHRHGECTTELKDEEETLFQSDVNMKVPIQASGPASVTVLVKKEDHLFKVQSVLSLPEHLNQYDRKAPVLPPRPSTGV